MFSRNKKTRKDAQAKRISADASQVKVSKQPDDLEKTVESKDSSVFLHPDSSGLLPASKPVETVDEPPKPTAQDQAELKLSATDVADETSRSKPNSAKVDDEIKQVELPRVKLYKVNDKQDEIQVAEKVSQVDVKEVEMKLITNKEEEEEKKEKLDEVVEEPKLDSDQSYEIVDSVSQPKDAAVNTPDVEEILPDNHDHQQQQQHLSASRPTRKQSSVRFSEKLATTNNSNVTNTNDSREIDIEISLNSEPSHVPSEVAGGGFCNLRHKMRFFIVAIAMISPFLVTYQKLVITLVGNEIRSEKHATWGQQKLGWLKSAYQTGHVPLQVYSGRMSEIHGPYYVMAIGSSLMGLTSILAPNSSKYFFLMYIDLALLGMFGSLMSPALFALFANWLAPSEKTLAVTFYLIASRLGAACCGAVTDLITKELNFSWPVCFRVAGLMSVLFTLPFLIFVRSKPIDHRYVSKTELDFLAARNKSVKESIEAKERKQSLELKQLNSVEIYDSKDEPTEPKKDLKKHMKAPWMAILKSKSVWGFFIAKTCTKVCGESLQNDLPTYFLNIIKDPRYAKNMAHNYFVFSIGCLISGICSWLLLRYNLIKSKTFNRKLFQCTASFGVALSLIMVAWMPGRIDLTKKLIFFVFFITTFGTAGEASIPFDLSTRYSATIHSVGSSIASVVSILEPIAAGWILEGHDKDTATWKFFWMFMGCISATGGLAFLILCKAEIQDFDYIDINGEQSAIEAAPNSTIVQIDCKPRTDRSQSCPTIPELVLEDEVEKNEESGAEATILGRETNGSVKGEAKGVNERGPV